MKHIISVCSLFLCAILFSGTLYAQDDITAFKNYQFSFTRVKEAWNKYNDFLKRDFEEKGIKYPCKDIYLRSFKSSNIFQVWARNNDTSKYTLVLSYPICALSGQLGPKRIEGDKQVPEGLYFIDEFNPQSDFYLSMLVSYPNYSDLINGDKSRPGGSIYIHGGCFTVGCLPMTNNYIQEIYVLCLSAKLAGQNYIPIHIYPIQFDRNGLNYLGKNYVGDSTRQAFWVNLKASYDYFERNKKLLPVMYTPDGKYAF